MIRTWKLTSEMIHAYFFVSKMLSVINFCTIFRAICIALTIMTKNTGLTLLHSERSKLYTILTFLSAIGLRLTLYLLLNILKVFVNHFIFMLIDGCRVVILHPFHDFSSITTIMEEDNKRLLLLWLNRLLPPVVVKI